MIGSREKELQRLRDLPDKEIDFSDIPELEDDLWENAQVTAPRKKQLISLRIDTDVLRWFKRRGKGYQTFMNVVLRSYMEHQKDSDN